MVAFPHCPSESQMEIQWVAVELWQYIVQRYESTTNNGTEKTYFFFLLALFLFLGVAQSPGQTSLPQFVQAVRLLMLVHQVDL